MLNSTTNTYQMKREIFNFLNKIFKHLSQPYKKFSADMTYGMLAAGSCLLTEVVDQLHEDTKKVNSVERLTKHLNNGTLCINILSFPKHTKKLASLAFDHKCIIKEKLINQFPEVKSCAGIFCPQIFHITAPLPVLSYYCQTSTL